MVRIISRLLIQAALFFSVSGVALAQTVPLVIPFQGLLADSDGDPLPTGTVPMTIKLYTVASGGSPVWTETHPAAEVTDGVFAVLLGSITSLAGVSFDKPYYVGVSVDGDPEMTPRVQLSSTPYALAMRNVYPTSSTVHVDAPGGVGINTTDIRTTLTVMGPDDREDGPILFMYGDDADQTESGRIRFVEGKAISNWRGGFIHYDGKANALHLGVHPTDDSLRANDKNVITIERSSSARVGIGTDSPSRELTVNDTDGSTDAVINVTAPNRELLLGVNQSSGGIIGMTTNNDLTLRTDGSIRMVIQADGDVQARNDLIVEGEILKDYGSSDYGLAMPLAMGRVDASSTSFRSSTANVGSLVQSSGLGVWTFWLDELCSSADPYFAQITVEETGVDDVHATTTCIDEVGCPGTGKCVRVEVETRNAFGAPEVDFNFVVHRVN